MNNEEKLFRLAQMALTQACNNGYKLSVSTPANDGIDHDCVIGNALSLGVDMAIEIDRLKAENAALRDIADAVMGMTHRSPQLSEALANWNRAAKEQGS